MIKIRVDIVDETDDDNRRTCFIKECREGNFWSFGNLMGQALNAVGPGLVYDNSGILSGLEEAIEDGPYQHIFEEYEEEKKEIAEAIAKGSQQL